MVIVWPVPDPFNRPKLRKPCGRGNLGSRSFAYSRRIRASVPSLIWDTEKCLAGYALPPKDEDWNLFNGRYREHTSSPLTKFCKPLSKFWLTKRWYIYSRAIKCLSDFSRQTNLICSELRYLDLTKYIPGWRASSWIWYNVTMGICSSMGSHCWTRSADGPRRPKLYFVKMDVQACFDTIEQGKLLKIIKELLSEVNNNNNTTLVLVGVWYNVFHCRMHIGCSAMGRFLWLLEKLGEVLSERRSLKVYPLFAGS